MENSIRSQTSLNPVPVQTSTPVVENRYLEFILQTKDMIAGLLPKKSDRTPFYNYVASEADLLQ